MIRNDDWRTITEPPVSDTWVGSQRPEQEHLSRLRVPQPRRGRETEPPVYEQLADIWAAAKRRALRNSPAQSRQRARSPSRRTLFEEKPDDDLHWKFIEWGFDGPWLGGRMRWAGVCGWAMKIDYEASENEGNFESARSSGHLDNDQDYEPSTYWSQGSRGLSVMKSGRLAHFPSWRRLVDDMASD